MFSCKMLVILNIFSASSVGVITFCSLSVCFGFCLVNEWTHFQYGHCLMPNNIADSSAFSTKYFPLCVCVCV